MRKTISTVFATVLALAIPFCYGLFISTHYGPHDGFWGSPCKLISSLVACVIATLFVAIRLIDRKNTIFFKAFVVGFVVWGILCTVFAAMIILGANFTDVVRCKYCGDWYGILGTEFNANGVSIYDFHSRRMCVSPWHVYRFIPVVLLLGLAAFLLVDKSKLPLALRGLEKVLGHAAPTSCTVTPVPAWKRLLAFVLVLAAFLIALP